MRGCGEEAKPQRAAGRLHGKLMLSPAGSKTAVLPKELVHVAGLSNGLAHEMEVAGDLAGDEVSLAQAARQACDPAHPRIRSQELEGLEVHGRLCGLRVRWLQRAKGQTLR